ncbi:Protein kinase protein with adenine nucleotide alpha hydrolases-like domain [Euphorbia peplus]|nr:Protein kinase protein with adenine nucleotide alpha hydrolases-like domain [Euphorbia peplus]
MARTGAEKCDQSVAIAIDKDEGSPYALKWAVNQFLSRGQSVTFLHVRQISSEDDAGPKELDFEAKHLFLPFHCYCTRKDIKCVDVLVEDVDIAKGIADFANTNVIENLVLGAASKGGLIPRLFNATDVPSTVMNIAPDFCTVYVIDKTNVSSVKTATASAPLQLQPQPPPQQLHSITSSASVDLASPSATSNAWRGTNQTQSSGCRSVLSLYKGFALQYSVSCSIPQVLHPVKEQQPSNGKQNVLLRMWRTKESS